MKWLDLLPIISMFVWVIATYGMLKVKKKYEELSKSCQIEFERYVERNLLLMEIALEVEKNHSEKEGEKHDRVDLDI